MDFIKKNYEKVLLGAVLLGLAVAAGFLPFKISSEKQNLEALTTGVLTPKVSPLTNIDLTMPQAALKRAAAPVVLDFTAPNKLFSPRPWQKNAEGRLVLMDDSNIGPRAVEVIKVTPLQTRITLDSIQGGETPKYVIGVERESASTQRERAKKQSYTSAGYQNDFLTVKEIQGPADNPSNIVLELRDGDVANINKDQSFTRVDGYMADLKYDPEKKTWRNQRVGDSVLLNGETYNLVAITSNEVVLSAKSNQKKWTITYNPNAAPEPR